MIFYFAKILSFLLSMLAKYGDSMVALLLSLPLDIFGTSGKLSLDEAVQSPLSSKAETGSGRKKRKLEVKDRSPHDAYQGSSVLAASQGPAQQRTPSAKEPAGNKDAVDSLGGDGRENLFNWSPYLTHPRAAEESVNNTRVAQRTALHGLCSRLIDLSREIDGQSALSRDVLGSAASDILEYKVVLVVRLAELLNQVASRMTSAEWNSVMTVKTLDINNFLVRWHMNLHCNLRNRLPAQFLRFIGTF